MKWSELKFILLSFIIWRISLFIILFFSVKFIPLSNDFLGGGYGNYIQNPFFWAWGNFDGQRYTSIAQNGYHFGEYTFFPLYPILIKFIGGLFGGSLAHYYLAGNIISNIFLIIALIGFYKLARIDFSIQISRMAIVLLLLFPTSFYFATVYTESLFFTLLVWSFYFVRQEKFLAASTIGALATITRTVGVFIFPAILLEWYINKYKTKNFWKSFPVSTTIIPISLLGYMYYLKIHVNDALAFFDQQIYVGEHRSSHIILIPQIIYRYLWKIIPNINLVYFPSLFFTLFEFCIGIFYFIFVFCLFFLTRFSYAVFALLAYFAPTILGSFSSMPRYALIIFPFYLVLANYLSRSKTKLFAFCVLSFILLVISFSLFVRGYWIS